MWGWIGACQEKCSDCDGSQEGYVAGFAIPAQSQRAGIANPVTGIRTAA